MTRNVMTMVVGFVVGVLACNQKPIVCPDGWDPAVQGCRGMPPLPVMVSAASDATVEADLDTAVEDVAAKMCSDDAQE